jgi:hypothetical protein
MSYSYENLALFDKWKYRGRCIYLAKPCFKKTTETIQDFDKVHSFSSEAIRIENSSKLENQANG